MALVASKKGIFPPNPGRLRGQLSPEPAPPSNIYSMPQCKGSNAEPCGSAQHVRVRESVEQCQLRRLIERRSMYCWWRAQGHRGTLATVYILNVGQDAAGTSTPLVRKCFWPTPQQAREAGVVPQPSSSGSGVAGGTTAAPQQPGLEQGPDEVWSGCNSARSIHVAWCE